MSNTRPKQMHLVYSPVVQGAAPKAGTRASVHGHWIRWRADLFAGRRSGKRACRKCRD